MAPFTMNYLRRYNVGLGQDFTTVFLQPQPVSKIFMIDVTRNAYSNVKYKIQNQPQDGGHQSQIPSRTQRNGGANVLGAVGQVHTEGNNRERR